MTSDVRPAVAVRSTPAAARLAILLLMASALLYGWQSGSVKRSPAGSSGAADAGMRKERQISATAKESSSADAHTVEGRSPPGPAHLSVSAPAAGDTAGLLNGIRNIADWSDVTDVLFWIINSTVAWSVGLVLIFVILLIWFPAWLQRMMSVLNDYGALLLVILTAVLLLLASIGFQNLRHAPQNDSAGTGAAVQTGQLGGPVQSTDDRTVVHDLYQVLQLLNFNTESNKLTGSLLGAAVAAGLIAVLAAREILQTLFYDLLAKILLILRRDHIVVIGLGRLGRQIVETMLCEKVARRRLIVVLERDPQNPNLKWARQKGLLVVQGDGSETEDLRRVQLRTAYEVFVCVGADESNIACLTTIHELHDEDQRIASLAGIWSALRRPFPQEPEPAVNHRPRCHVHIMNHDLLRAVRLFEQKREAQSADKSDIQNGPSDGTAGQPTVHSTPKKKTMALVQRQPDLEIFSTPERTIWKLMTELERLKSGQWPSVFVEGWTPAGQGHIKSDDTWHYILLGFGEFGRTLALSLAEHSHTENGRRVRMTVCDRDIQPKQSQFLSRYSQFCPPINVHLPDAHLPAENWFLDSAPDHWTWSAESTGTAVLPEKAGSHLQPLTSVCRADFLEYDEATDDRFFDLLVQRVCQPGVRTAVFVCFEDEKENFTTAMRLNQKLKDRIQQTSFPKPGPVQSADGDKLAARLCWPVFAWLPRQMKLAKLVEEIERRQVEDQRTAIVAYLQKLREAEQDRLGKGLAIEADQPKAQALPQLSFRPILIPFGQNYENISYSEITDSWLDWVARLIQLVWEEPMGCKAHTRLRQLVQLHNSNLSAPSDNPWEQVFTGPQGPDFVPPHYRIEDWVNSFAEIDWQQLKQTSEQRWYGLPEWQRSSNRSAAIHSVLKVATFGLRIVGRCDHRSTPEVRYHLLQKLTMGMLQTLSEMEHNRWVAERLLDGWWFHQQRGERTRWQLTPFCSLPCQPLNPKDDDMKDQREKDARIILLVLGLMASGQLKTQRLQDG